MKGNMEDKIDIVLGILLVVFIVGMLIFGVIDSSKYIYKCKDTQGNTIYCTRAETSKGGMFGIMEDGTRVTITSYKLVEREEK